MLTIARMKALADGATVQAMAGDRRGGDAGAYLQPSLLRAARRRALFTGDHVMGWSTSIVSPPDGDMADYMRRSMQKLLEREDTIYYPHMARQWKIRSGLVRGYDGPPSASGGQILRHLGEAGVWTEHRDMVPEMYKGVLLPSPPRRCIASVLAHLLRPAAARAGTSASGKTCGGRHSAMKTGLFHRHHW